MQKSRRTSKTYPRPDLRFEASLRGKGFTKIAGLDEAGRGSLAGPIVAAAVILPKILPDTLSYVNDSKKMAPKARIKAEVEIKKAAVAWALGVVSEKVIEKDGISRAGRAAMLLAFRKLHPTPDYLLIDAFELPQKDIPQIAIVKGDTKSVSIAAASVLAKTERDRIMGIQHKLWPVYRFDQHKGYGTARHVETLKLEGPCPIHRRNFNPTKQILNLNTQHRLSLPPGTGKAGEAVASYNLRSMGFKIVCTNYVSRYGEIDIVALKDGRVAFVEVKTRRNSTYGKPEESLTHTKALKLTRAAYAFLQTEQSYSNLDWGIDLMAIELNSYGKVERVELFSDAVQDDFKKELWD